MKKKFSSFGKVLSKSEQQKINGQGDISCEDFCGLRWFQCLWQKSHFICNTEREACLRGCNS